MTKTSDDGYIKFQCYHTATETLAQALAENQVKNLAGTQAKNQVDFLAETQVESLTESSPKMLLAATIPDSFLSDLEELDRLRTFLFDAGYIGMNKDGVGFGNVSIRIPDSSLFVISATATGGSRELGLEGYCVIEKISIPENTVWCRGPLKASSESMTHGAIYMNSAAGCVVHIHSAILFEALSGQSLSTPLSAAYGTPAMAQALADIAARYPNEGCVIMSGHQDGIVFYGPDCRSVSSLISFIVHTYGQSSQSCAGSGCSKDCAACSCQQGSANQK